MRVFTASTIALLSASAFGFQCPSANEPGDIYDRSTVVALIEVTSVSLNRDWTAELDAENPDSAGSVRALEVEFDVTETLKGTATSAPAIELLGIGTGYVGFTPGVYYLVALDGPSRGRYYISFCDVIASHYRLDVAEFQRVLGDLRKRGT